MDSESNKKQSPPRAFRLTPELDRELAAIQQETGLTRSFIIRSCVELAIERLKPTAAQWVS